MRICAAPVTLLKMLQQRYPTLRADQFGADIAATANAANRSRRRIENNADSLR